MFRIIAIISLMVAFLFMIVHYLIIRRNCPSWVSDFQWQSYRDNVRQYSFVRRWLYILIYLAAILSMLVLAGTGLVFAVINRPLSGYMLMVHVTAAPVFMLALAAVAIISANMCRISKTDWQVNACSRGWSKILFWLVISCAPVVILSMILSMVPLFGTAGQVFLYELHRYSALVMTVSSILLFYFVRAGRPGLFGILVSGRGDLSGGID